MQEVLTDRAIIEIKGSEALPFLQKMTTADLTASDYCYTYMLNNQGRYWFDFFVFVQNPELLIVDIAASQVQDFVSKLMLYKLRSKVEFVDKSMDYAVLYSRSFSGDAVCTKQDPRFAKLGLRSIIKKQEGYHTSHEGLYLQDKYEFAIPDGSIDLVYEKSIPIEFGAEELGAISYSKGCYIGQEVISRTKYQGVVRKKIFKLISKSAFDQYSHHTDIVLHDMKIGVLCSYYKNIAIALLREEHYLSIEPKVIMLEAGEVEVTVPSWRSLSGV